MDILQTQRTANDLSKSGKFCFQDGNELEIVSETTRYTCHFCGGVYETHEEKGQLVKIEVHFEGFK